jgi:hypothetical protein
VQLTIEALAQARGDDVDELRAATSTNARTAFAGLR